LLVGKLSDAAVVAAVVFSLTDLSPARNAIC
jgi:hypothetical protein